MDGIVGNSSSGLLEAPSFKIATVNIGDRQLDRLQASSIINCPPLKSKIITSIKKIYSKNFKKRLRRNINPYGKSLKHVSLSKAEHEKRVKMKNFYAYNAISEMKVLKVTLFGHWFQA